MLWDPKKDKPVDPFNPTLDHLIAWLETKPANGTYTYSEPQRCLLCQYLKDHGVANPYANSKRWGTTGVKFMIFRFKSVESLRDVPADFDMIAKGDAAGLYQSWCYGSALIRARIVRERRWTAKESSDALERV